MRPLRMALPRPGLVAALTCSLALAACDPMSAPLVRHQAAFQPVADGGLRIWPGQHCPGIRQVRVQLEVADGQPRETWVLRSERRSGATFTGLTIDEVPAGFVVSREWPVPPAWRDAKTVWIRVKTAGGQTSSYVSVDSMLEEDTPGDDEYYVEDQGWLTGDEFTDLTRRDEGVSPLCGPGTPAT